MSSDVIFRQYEPGDEEGIVELLNEAFGGWPKLRVDSLDYWRWKYVDSPLWRNDTSVAVAGDRIIGCKHSVYLNLKVGDEVLVCNLGSDLAVHEDYRGMGISTKLSSLSTERKLEIGADLTYFVTSNPILVGKYRRENMSLVLPSRVAVYVLIKDVDAQVDEMQMRRPLLMKAAYRGSFLVNQVKNMARGRRMYRGMIKEVDEFCDGADVLWEKTGDQYGFIVKRDSKYLNWRYTDPGMLVTGYGTRSGRGRLTASV